MSDAEPPAVDAAMAERPTLSVVAPVYNEAAVVEALYRRICAAAATTGRAFEVILVDDHSSDETPDIIQRLVAETSSGAAVLQPCRLDRNMGQIGATLHGLGRARGDLVVVLDGDLQDPPEVLGALVQRFDRGDVDLVFATKARRDDPGWFMAGSWLFHLAQRLAARHRVPRGAGSYVVLSRQLARRVSRIRVRNANLSALLVALGPALATVDYDKGPRYDGHSRVGPAGLALEALGSLALTGALGRGLLVMTGFAGLAAVLTFSIGCWSGAVVLCALAGSLAVGAIGVHLRVAALLRSASNTVGT